MRLVTYLDLWDKAGKKRAETEVTDEGVTPSLNISLYSSDSQDCSHVFCSFHIVKSAMMSLNGYEGDVGVRWNASTNR